MNEKHLKKITLIESLFAFLILAISVSAILSLLSITGEMGDLLDHRQTAVQLASRQIERLREENFSQLPLFSEDSVKVDEDGNYDPAGSFTRTTRVQFADASSYNVSVNVEYTGSFLRKKTSVSLSTALVDYSKIR